jgi:DNA-binding NtrC family response regulator
MNQCEGKKILVVDDQRRWREALQMLLEKDGHVVNTAENYDIAYEELETREFDLVTLDIRLEDRWHFNVQGLKLLQLIEEIWPRTKVIILTGYPESIREGFLDEHRVDALVLKVPPESCFDASDFLKTVNRLLSSTNASRVITP